MKLCKHGENDPRGSTTQGEITDDRLILIGLGANLPSAYGEPAATLRVALAHLTEAGIGLIRRSRFWHSAPVPISDQPWYVNAVAAIETDLASEPLLALLHEIEAKFGRVRGVVNAPRLIDLDLLAYGREIRTEGAPLLPHPRLAERAFVLLPLSDIAPHWRHPLGGQSLSALIAELDRTQRAQPIADAD